MPTIDEGKVADPKATKYVPSVSIMTGCLTRLAGLATSKYDGPAWAGRNRESEHSSDWGVMLAEVWFERASGRLDKIFDSQTLSSEWWRQLRRSLYFWLMLKHGTLKYAYETLGVPAIDIASQIVSFHILFCVRRSAIHALITSPGST